MFAAGFILVDDVWHADVTLKTLGQTQLLYFSIVGLVGNHAVVGLSLEQS